MGRTRMQELDEKLEPSREEGRFYEWCKEQTKESQKPAGERQQESSNRVLQPD